MCIQYIYFYSVLCTKATVSHFYSYPRLLLDQLRLSLGDLHVYLNLYDKHKPNSSKDLGDTQFTIYIVKKREKKWLISQSNSSEEYYYPDYLFNSYFVRYIWKFYIG